MQSLIRSSRHVQKHLDLPLRSESTKSYRLMKSTLHCSRPASLCIQFLTDRFDGFVFILLQEDAVTVATSTDLYQSQAGTFFCRTWTRFIRHIPSKWQNTRYLQRRTDFLLITIAQIDSDLRCTRFNIFTLVLVCCPIHRNRLRKLKKAFKR